METYEFKRWCEKAVSGIIFPPDRRRVYRELMNHMEDHRDYLLEQGMGLDTAQDMAVEAMGNPWPIAKDLAAIHRPFWGYALRATRVVLVIALLATIIPFCIHIWNADYTPSMWPGWDLFSEESYGGDTGRTLLHLSEPNVSEASNGYRFTLTNAVRWQTEEYDSDCLLLRMKEFHPLPWAGHGEAGGWFWAEDSLGNTYICNNEYVYSEDPPALFASGSMTGPFTYTYQLWINHAAVEAEWVDIRYTRDGRNLVWRIDLSGGDAA